MPGSGSQQNSGAVAVIIGNRSGEGRNRDTVLYRVSDDIAQRLLVVIGDLLEVRSQQQVSDLRIFGISIVIFCRNCARMMQPARKIFAISP